MEFKVDIRGRSYFVIEGFVFIGTGQSVLKCAFSNCEGTHDIALGVASRDHNHQPNEAHVAGLKRHPFLELLRQFALSSSDVARLAAHLFFERYPDASGVMSVESAIGRIRRFRGRSRPHLPACLRTAGEMLERRRFQWLTERHSQFGNRVSSSSPFLYGLNEVSGVALLKMLSVHRSNLSSDPTELCVILIQFEDVWLLEVYANEGNLFKCQGFALLDGETEDALTAALQSIVSSETIRTIWASFHSNLNAAASALFLQATIRGSLVFFMQRVVELVNVDVLSQAYRREFSYGLEALQMCCALLFLQPHRLGSGLAAIQTFCQDREVPPALYSGIEEIFLSEFSTGDICLRPEGMNTNMLTQILRMGSVITTILSSTCPYEGFWSLYNAIRMLDMRYEAPQPYQVPQGIVDLASQIMALLHNAENITVEEVLETGGRHLARRVNNCVRLHTRTTAPLWAVNNPPVEGHPGGQENFHEGNEEVGPAAETATHYVDDNSLCITCVTRKREYALIPCGHYALCGRCILRLNMCVICRSSVTSKLRIFEV